MERELGGITSLGMLGFRWEDGVEINPGFLAQVTKRMVMCFTKVDHREEDEKFRECQRKDGEPGTRGGQMAIEVWISGAFSGLKVPF